MMDMFHRRIDINKVSGMLTSKFELKIQCLNAAHGNIDEASKLYKYLSDGIELPNVMEKKTVYDRIKEGALEVAQVYKENKGDIIEAIDTISAICGSKKQTPKVSIPPIPPINEGGTEDARK